MSVGAVVRQDVLVYKDKGVNDDSADAIVNQVKSLVDAPVLMVDSEFLLKQSWEERTLALFMGGGICSKWEKPKRLGEEGRRKIYDFAHGGGFVVGICAGACFWTKTTQFKPFKGDLFEKERTFPFLKGRAVAPIFRSADHLSIDSARAMDVAFKVEKEWQKGKLYYLGGPYFDVPASPDVSVEGQFEELDHFQEPHVVPKGAAAVHCQLNKGGAYLLPFHIEFAWTEKIAVVGDPSFAKYSRLANQLFPHEQFRINIWRQIARLARLPLRV